MGNLEEGIAIAQTDTAPTDIAVIAVNEVEGPTVISSITTAAREKKEAGPGPQTEGSTKQESHRIQPTSVFTGAPKSQIVVIPKTWQS